LGCLLINPEKLLLGSGNISAYRADFSFLGRIPERSHLSYRMGYHGTHYPGRKGRGHFWGLTLAVPSSVPELVSGREGEN
jgi:hypothetical protein